MRQGRLLMAIAASEAGAALKARLAGEIERIRGDSLFKEERIITGPQGLTSGSSPGARC